MAYNVLGAKEALRVWTLVFYAMLYAFGEGTFLFLFSEF